MSSSRDRNERIQILREKLGNVPQKPGVYLHKDAKAGILYVGKAKNLQARLRSYFTGLERHGPKTQALVAKIQDFDVIIVENESESLVLENNLIKHHKPPYNFLLRDDKTYPYLKVNLKEDWPRVVMTRQRKNDGALYFGPFTTGSGLSALLAIIHRYFPLIKCTPNVFKTVSRPCNYYEMKRCLGPCKLPVEQKVYRAVVNDVVAILQGRTGEVLKSLKRDMKSASENLAFEKAAELRDQIQALENLERGQSVALVPGFDADIVGDFWQGDSVAFYVSILRDGKLVGGKGFVLKRQLDEIPSEETEERDRSYQKEALEAFVCQYYQNNVAPARIYIPSGIRIFNEDERDRIEKFVGLTRNEKEESQQVVVEWDENFAKEKTRDKVKRVLLDGLETLCRLTCENARNKLQEELKVDEAGHNLLRGLQTLLGLPQPPSRLECYDISTFQGAETVASQVVFKNGRPAKSEYRHYIIRDTVGQDDFASLREVMRRRFNPEKYTEEPDCLVVDGGEPQVREVGRMLKVLGRDNMCFFGLAKSRTQKNFASSEVLQSEERLVVPYRAEGELDPNMPPKTIVLKQGSPEFRLLTQMRDEAHRFAITFHRKRRDKASFRSLLNSVEGLGPKRRKKLFSVYPSFSEMKQASAEDISRQVGIPLRVAQSLKEVLESKDS